MSQLIEFLVQWVQTGIRCSHIQSFVQPSAEANTSPAYARIDDEDVPMKEHPFAAPGSSAFGFTEAGGDLQDLPEKVWDELRSFAQHLANKSPATLAPHELALLQLLRRREQSLPGHTRRDLKRSYSVKDEVMGSPPPLKRQLPDDQSFVRPALDETTKQRKTRSSHLGTRSSLRFNHGRHRPYARTTLDATSRMGGFTKRVRKQTAAIFPEDRETRQRKGKLAEKERELKEAREEVERARLEAERNAWRLRVEMKKLEVLEWARTALGGEGFDENAFKAQYFDFLQEEAERLCVEEDANNRRREENDKRFAHAVGFIESIFKEEIDRYIAMEQQSRAEAEKVDADELQLTQAIQETCGKLEQLQAYRDSLLIRKTQYNDQLQRITDARVQLFSHLSERLEFLENAMAETGQDFFAAWTALQNRFRTGPQFWPPGIIPPPPPSESHFASSSEHSLRDTASTSSSHGDTSPASASTRDSSPHPPAPASTPLPTPSASSPSVPAPGLSPSLSAPSPLSAASSSAALPTAVPSTTASSSATPSTPTTSTSSPSTPVTSTPTAPIPTASTPTASIPTSSTTTSPICTPSTAELPTSSPSKPASPVPPVQQTRTTQPQPTSTYSASRTTAVHGSTPAQPAASATPKTPASPASPPPPPPTATKRLPARRPRSTKRRIASYAEDWELLKSGQLVDAAATFEQMPWPVSFSLRKDRLDDLTIERVREFVLHPDRLTGKLPHKLLMEELLRWHSDKLTAILPKFVPEHRPFIQAAGNRIATYLLQLRDSL